MMHRQTEEYRDDDYSGQTWLVDYWQCPECGEWFATEEIDAGLEVCLGCAEQMEINGEIAS